MILKEIEMSESFDHGHVESTHLTGPSALIAHLFGSRFVLSLND
jgi:hypothetical protein